MRPILNLLNRSGRHRHGKGFRPLDHQRLLAIPYLRSLGTEDLRGLAQAAIEQTLAPGEILFHEGEPSKGLALVLEGTVKVSRISREGREQVLLVVGPGQTMNEVPVFDGGTCPATATAVQVSQVCTLPTEIIHELVRERPQVAADVLRYFAGRLRGLVQLVADLTHLDVATRVAKILLSYHQSSGVRTFNLSQSDLAAMVGTTREVVARALRRLEEAGGVMRQRGAIRVVSVDRLAEAIDDED